MRLLVVTQAVDEKNPVLGFFVRWIQEFAMHCESVVVICLEKGTYTLPDNVRVLSLGKEEGNSKWGYVARFYKYIWQERYHYDAVFVHMNPEYVNMGGLLWRMWGKRVGLWYVHKAVNFKIWLAEKLVHTIFTSAPESFKTKSRKVKYVGHGIDMDRFEYRERELVEPLRVMHVGRVTRIKGLDTILKATKVLEESGVQVEKFALVGSPVTADDAVYKSELVDLSKVLGIESKIEWKGSVLNSEVREEYYRASLSVNATPDGGMDKSVLESWATGCPAFASNKAFSPVLGDSFMYEHSNAEDLAEKIVEVIKKPTGIKETSKKVRKNFSLKNLVEKILINLEKN